MKDGGLIVKYYSWTQINFNRGLITFCIQLVFCYCCCSYVCNKLFSLDFTAILVITNCRNTWRAYNSARKETLLLIALTESDCPRLPLKEAITVFVMVSSANSMDLIELPYAMFRYRFYPLARSFRKFYLIYVLRNP